MTGQHERADLVADLPSGQRHLVLAGGDEQVQQIGRRVVRVGDAVLDDRVDEMVHELRAGIVAGLGALVGTEQPRGDTIASIFIALADGLMVQWLLDPVRRLDPATLRQVISALVATADERPAGALEPPA